jgi:hypothetical protein
VQLANIEKSYKGVRKSRHGIIGGRTSKRAFHVQKKESIVALVGMGGIWNTTLSKNVYHFSQNQY